MKNIPRFELTLLVAGLLHALSAQPTVGQQIPAYHAGFPLLLPGEGNVVFSQSIAADLGLTPGYKSIIFGLRNGKLVVVRRNANGTWGLAPGFPVQLPSHIGSHPSVGDLTGDGIPEIVVGFGSTLEGAPPFSDSGGIRAYRRDGTLLWERLPQDSVEGPDGFPDPVVGSAAIGDVDGDGLNEVVFGALDFNLYVVRGSDGQNEPGWPKLLRDSIFSSPALHDLNGDGRLDIVIGSDSHAEGPPFNTPNGGCINVLAFDSPGNGTTPSPIVQLPGFPRCINQVVSSSPVVGDIDGDGRPEIVHGTGRFFAGDSEKLYAWNCDGSPVWGTVGNPGLLLTGLCAGCGGRVVTSPALANLDGDPALEVVVTANNERSSTVHHLYAFNGDGSVVFTPATVRDFFAQSLSGGDPMVADVLGNSEVEILVPTNGEVAVFSRAGVILTDDDNFPAIEPSFMTQGSLSGVFVTDLETTAGTADNKIEVVAISQNPAGDTAIHVWNPINSTSTPPWGAFQRTENRLGTAPGTPGCWGTCAVADVARRLHTLAPCRLFDTRDPVGPRGGPALQAGALRDFPVRNICGVPAGARAVSLNVTVVGPTGSGNVALAPGCRPIAANAVVNFSAGQVRANNTIVSIDALGFVTATALVSGNGSVHAVADVNGYFE